MQAEQDYDSPGNRSHQRLMLQQKLSDGARRSAETDEYHGESRDKRQRGSKQAITRGLPRAQLLDADARKHRDIARHERKHARRQERDDSRYEGVKNRNLHRTKLSPEKDGAMHLMLHWLRRL